MTAVTSALFSALAPLAAVSPTTAPVAHANPAATFQLLIALLAVVAAVVMLARKIHIPVPILLVPAGMGLAMVPFVGTVPLDPHVVISLLLPPLVYAAAINTSWPSFKAHLWPIGLLAFGCVTFTTLAVAAVAHYVIGMNWAVGAVLGAVCSPPDTVAATAIASQMNFPRRVRVILEGEGLVNDAAALVLIRVTAAAAVGGAFHFGHTAGLFAIVVVGEVVWGLFVGWAITLVRKWAEDGRVSMLLSVLTPFAAFLPVEHAGGSGVLAVAVAGLWVGWNGWTAVSPGTRLAGRFFWDVLVFLIEGVLFLLTGMEFTNVRSTLKRETWPQLLGWGGTICITVIAVRFLWVFAVMYLPRWSARARLKFGDPEPWTHPFVLSMAGMRGTISLAAALGLSEGFTALGNTRFDDRTLIIFLTFCVILVTLVGQGLALPPIVRHLGLAAEGEAEHDAARREGFDARIAAVKASLIHLDSMADDYHPDVVAVLRTRHEGRLRHLQHHRAEEDDVGDRIDVAERRLLAAMRRHLYRLRRGGKVSDEASRQIEHELDLEDARLLPDEE